MSAISRDVTSAGMAAAIEANLNAAFPLFSSLPSIELHDEPALRWLITPDVPFPLFNHVYWTRLPQESIDVRVEEVRERFAACQVPMMWSIGPFTRPSDLGSRLEARGAAHAEDLPGMALDLQALNEDVPSPDGLAIEGVGNAESLREYVDVAKVGFELPEVVAQAFFDAFGALGLVGDRPVRHYVGRLDREAVASATLVLMAGVAGIYNVATLPKARRQGVGAAMTLAAFREARKLGYRIGILQSSAAGFNVYRRLGFEQYSTYSVYVWAA